MADDIFPSNDAEFDLFQAQFITQVVADPAKHGLLPADAALLQTEQAAWIPGYAGHVKAQADARTATQKKETVRGRLETALRGAAKKINGTASVDNALRASVGLAPREGTRGSIGAPTTRPLGRIDVTGRFTLVIHFVDAETPQRLAKPQGVQGCQIWSYVGETPPADPAGFTFVALDTRTPYTDELAATDGGKNAHYLLRWQNSKGEPGPWSDVVSAKIRG